MWESNTREDGYEVHKFMCDYDGCLRRTFTVIHKESDEFHDLHGWSGIGPSDAEHVSQLKHYCRKHPTP